jgi:hypothetical protein
MGGPAKDSLFGAVAGSAVAMLYTSMRAGAIDSFTVNLCLVMGGIIGANFAVFLALRKRLRAKRLALTH